MIQTLKTIRTLALSVACVTALQAAPLLNFQFNEGEGVSTVDSVNGLVGLFAQDPAIDTVQLVDQSSSGQSGDRSIATAGGGFLIADASGVEALNTATNGPITMETWMLIDPLTPAKSAEGILAYGNSYKMGLRSGYLTFTLYGKKDVEYRDLAVPAGEWVHLATAWDPGVGVHFYINGVESFIEDTNTTARVPLHNLLSIASEGLGNNSFATFDRVRMHTALLTADQLDSVAATPKAPLASTVLSYNFDQAELPATNSVSPALPAGIAAPILAELIGPSWTNDTPAHAAGSTEEDFALAFLKDGPVKEVVTVNYGATPIDLSINNNSYTLQTWVKASTAPIEERRVIFRTDGPAPRVALSIDVNRTLHTTVIGTADWGTSVPLPNDNRWHHIAVVMDNFNEIRFYLDGVLRQTVAQTDTDLPSANTTPRLLIGKEGETKFYRGLLDRVIIHNEALPEESLDYPAIPGVATFEDIAAHPANVTTDPGETATFTATPTSATPITGQQWYVRSKFADATGTPVAGATSSTLTLENVTAADEGFYYLVVTNSAGHSESYAAELIVSAPTVVTGFEPPTYISGPLESQDHWTTDRNGNVVRVLTAEEISDYLEANAMNPAQPVHGGNQAILLGGPGLSTASIRRIAGLEEETKVTFDFWARPLTGADVGNTFFTAENATGIRAAALRLGPDNRIDYGTAIQGVWQDSGLRWDPNNWYHITMVIDYTTKTYDFLVNGTAVNTSPIPFYDARSDSFRQIRLFRGGNQAGAILDDLSVTGPTTGGDEPPLQIRDQGDNLVIAWPGSADGFILQATDQLDTPNWTTVTHTTQGAENQAVIETTGTMRFFRLIKN